MACDSARLIASHSVEAWERSLAWQLMSIPLIVRRVVARMNVAVSQCPVKQMPLVSVDGHDFTKGVKVKGGDDGNANR